MSGASFGALLDFPRLKRPDERRLVWRQVLAALARAASQEGPGPLEGLHPDVLVTAVRLALADGLLDDTDWLSEAAAGAALYELASALPVGNEQRELGRRVLGRLLQGNAETFTAIATRMALGTGKGLSGVGVRARIALVTELPLSLRVGDGPMCLAFVSRRHLARELIVQPSTAALPARRAAARIFERAAREAATRAQQGDDHAVRAFAADGVSQAFERLLADREPLVWRHAAIARGLLVPWSDKMRRAVQDGVDPKLSPTEWRRAAASIAALMSVEPVEAERLTKRFTGPDGALAKDPGAAGALVWGLARAAEAEPDAAAALLDQLAERLPLQVAEAAADAAAEWGSAEPFDKGVTKLVASLRGRGPDPSEGEGDALLDILRDLERLPRRRASIPDAVEAPAADEPMRAMVASALVTFAGEGSRAAYARAKDLLGAASGLLDALEAVAEEEDEDDGAGALARRTALTVLRDLDISLLERSTLVDLLRLAPTTETVRAHEDAALAARDRIATWVLARFRDRERDDDGGRLRHVTLRARRLRAMLHLVDSDLGDEDPARASQLRARWSRIAWSLLQRLEGSIPAALRRAHAATLARTLDALVRAEAIDPADALLAVVRRVDAVGDLRILAEASMDPALRHAFARYADMTAALVTPRGTAESIAPPGDVAASLDARLAAVLAWTQDGLLDPSSRAEALRTVVLRLHQSASAIAHARSLADLCTGGETDPDVVAAFEAAVASFMQMSHGARSRLNPDAGKSAPPLPPHEESLAVAVARVLSGAEASPDPALVEGVRSMAAELPAAMESLVSLVIDVVARLPARAAEGRTSAARMHEQLPPWLPPRRTLGGFYILRPLGSGAVGSVLVACRVEERQEPDAERFALKVPSYDAVAARSVSEAEFFQMFRAEASALLSLPAHPNLARFVTFDTGSKPKPILVMELVEGPNLDHEIQARALDMGRCFEVFEDVLAGLEAMHGVEVGHLDLKPGNVVLRHGHEAVLVDFGLAGRHIRPGCGTGPYGAPEVWGAEGPGTTPTPMKADVYAFGCLAFEALTGQTLFVAEGELQQIALHLSHDGFPDKLRKMAERPELAPLAEILFSTLRRDPQNRPAPARLRAELRKLAPSLGKMRWPLPA